MLSRDGAGIGGRTMMKKLVRGGLAALATVAVMAGGTALDAVCDPCDMHR